jgi:hypothetical protein
MEADPGASGRALQTLRRADNDILDLPEGGLVCRFGGAGERRTLEVTARIVEEPLEGLPFRFPVENLFRPATSPAAFYTYRLGEHPGALSVDGALENERLDEAPLFRVRSQPVSGHPGADTLAWVRDDGKRLYVAVDFACDNTLDGDRDWAEVSVRVGGNVRPFRVSVPERRWGAVGFTSTATASWEHKVYEFAIPFDEIGQPEAKQPLELAVAAYGTAVVAATIDLLTEAAQSSIGIPGAPPSACSQGTLGTPPPWSIIGSQRDLNATAPVSSPGPISAQVGPPGLVFNGTAGFGTATVVWDGVDDCLALGTTTSLGNFAALGSQVTIVASNVGTAPANVRIRIQGPSGYLESPLLPLNPGVPLSPIPFSTFIPNGTVDFTDVRAVVMEIDTTAYGVLGAQIQVQLVAITGPPLPVELVSFEVE